MAFRCLKVTQEGPQGLAQYLVLLLALQGVPQSWQPDSSIYNYIDTLSPHMINPRQEEEPTQSWGTWTSFVHSSWDLEPSLFSTFCPGHLGLSCLKFAGICVCSSNRRLYSTQDVCCVLHRRSGLWEVEGWQKCAEPVGHTHPFLDKASFWEATTKKP